MTITFFIIIAILKYLQYEGPRIWSNLQDSIDKSIKEDAEDFSRFRVNVFFTLDQIKHPLDEDGFERLV